MKNTRERNRGMDRPNWGKDPFTKFRKQRGNPQIGQPPGLIPKKGYPIFGLALLALHTPTVKSGRPAKQHISREGLALLTRTGTERSVCDTTRSSTCAGDYTLIMGDGHRAGGGEGEGLGEEMTVKRQRADEGGLWGVPRPQG